MSSGGKGSKSAKTPDYSALAIQQAELNKQAAMDLTALNRPNQYDAFGNSITWNQTYTPAQQQALDFAQADLDNYRKAMVANASWWDQNQVKTDLAKREKALADAKAAGSWSQNQNLSPEFKAIADKYYADAGKASGAYGDLLNQYLSQYSSQQFDPGAALKSYNDTEFNGDNVANALYESVMGRARPEQERNSAAMDTQLKNQGLVPGSEAYNRAMQNLLTSQNDANLLASQNAVLAGAQEGRNKYASYLTGQGQGYSQNLNTYLTNRNQPLQELSGMAGIAGGSPYQPTYPSFNSAAGYQPADLLGAAQAPQAANQQKANSSNSKKGGLLSAGTSLGGAYLGGK